MTPAVAQRASRQCLHGTVDAPVQKERREQALQLAHRVHAAEMRARGGPRGSQPYAPLPDLSIGRVPEGFEVQLTTDGETYSFTIKDRTDPCRYAIFSDQEGVIFHGTPVTGGFLLPLNGAE
jgi:hypothetical protein